MVKTQRPVSAKKFIVPLENQRGIALISILILLPLLLSTLLGLTTFYFSLQTWKEQAHLCRNEALKIQRSLSTNLSSLLKLNRPAQLLQKAEIAAQAALAAAVALGQIKAVMAAKKVLKAIHTKQKALGFAQKALINKSRADLLAKRWILNREIQQTQSPWAAMSLRISNPPPLAVHPEKPHPRAPIYRLDANFTHRQSIEIRWEANLLAKLFSLSSGWHSKQKLGQFTFPVRCRATLQKKEKKWIPRLMIEAKPLWN